MTNDLHRRDLATEIETALEGLDVRPLTGGELAVNAVRAVMKQHEHTFLNQYYNEAEFAKAQYGFGRCVICGNTIMWCSTVITIAVALGVAE